MAERTFRQYADLEDALEQKHIPLENRPIIRAFVAAIGCFRFEETTSYIKATRIKPGPQLEIAYGWTDGFETREEAEAAGGVAVWPIGRRWGIDHPVNRGTGDRSKRSLAPVTSGKFCPTCHLELTATGECPDGDEL
jgi:hypothetical protein